MTQPGDDQYERIALLVGRARRGDEGAFRSLLDGHRRAVTSTLFACGVRDPDTAGDLAQDVAVRAWTRLDRLHDPRTFPAWIRRIAANAARDHLRRRAVRREDDLELAVEVADDDDPEARSGRLAETRLMLAALESEDGELVELLVARAEGVPVEELAHRTGLTEGALKMRLMRVRKRLRARLDELRGVRSEESGVRSGGLPRRPPAAAVAGAGAAADSPAAADPDAAVGNRIGIGIGSATALCDGPLLTPHSSLLTPHSATVTDPGTLRPSDRRRMMRPPTCTDHGRLALDLALGRLDDAGAARADQALAGCAACSAWWRTAFEGVEVDAVDAAVADGFARVELPRRRSSRLWLAAAAAAVIAVASLALLPGPGPQPQGVPTAAIQAVEGGPDGVLAVMTFEPSASAEPSPQELFDAGFEDGELGDWSQGT